MLPYSPAGTPVGLFLLRIVKKLTESFFTPLLFLSFFCMFVHIPNNLKYYHHA